MTNKPESTTDAQLIARSRKDAAAFGEVYRRYVKAIYRYHWRCTHDSDAAYDLTAETFAQAWLARKRFRDDAAGSAAPWLYGIARNVLLMSVRRARTERTALQRLGLLSDPAAVSGSEHTPDKTWLIDLEDALHELPASQREAVELRFIQDLTYEDVATALDTSPQAVRVRVHKALKALRTRLEHTS